MTGARLPEAGTGWELGVVNFNVHSFLWVREFFVFYRMIYLQIPWILWALDRCWWKEGGRVWHGSGVRAWGLEVQAWGAGAWGSACGGG